MNRTETLPTVRKTLTSLRTWLSVAMIVVVLVATFAVTQAPIHAAVLGALVGISYGLLAVCLVLIFRVSGVINFAQPAIGMFAMSCMPMLVVVMGLPYWLAFALVLPVGFFVSAAVDALVIRRLKNVPRVVDIIATLGTAGVLANAATFTTKLGSRSDAPLPSAPGLPGFQFGPLLVTPGYTALIIIAPIITIGLWFFLTKTRWGLATLASANNSQNAQLLGISPWIVSALAWGLAGVVSTAMTILFYTNVPSSAATSVLSPVTLLPALAAAAIARFRGLSTALLAGIGIGIVRQALIWSDLTAPYTDVALLIIVAIALIYSRGLSVRAGATSAWVAVSTWRPLPPELHKIWLIRHGGLILKVLFFAALIYLGIQSTQSGATMTLVVSVMTLTFAATMFMGLTGELSLGVFATAVVAGGLGVLVTISTGAFFLGMAVAIVVGIVITVILAIISQQLRGLSLPILSLAFATAAPSLLFGNNVIQSPQPVIGGFAFVPGAPYFVFACIFAIICASMATLFWRSGFARVVRAARDNPSAAEALGLRPAGIVMRVAACAGALIGVGGAILIFSYDAVSPSALPSDFNLRIVLAAVMGGVGALWGGPVGVLWLFTAFAGQATTSSDSSGGSTLAIYATALILILVAPGGISALMESVRNVIVVVIARLWGKKVSLGQVRGQRSSAEEEAKESVAERSARVHFDQLVPVGPITEPDPTKDILRLRNIGLKFESITAVEGVSLDIKEGEVLGIIGPNGAGKTSLFDVLSGFLRPSTGTIEYRGEDITKRGPAWRSEQGLVRSFQNAKLFPTLTVYETIMVALERRTKSSALAGMVGVEFGARSKRQTAEDIIEIFGLEPFRDSRIQNLSTGTRRFTELACLTSLGPKVLLLDEPSSGIAQRESEALGPALRTIGDRMGTTMIIIEHDIPLVMSLSDRILTMAEGRELALGAPDEVRNNQRVIDAYLGNSDVAVNRSDTKTIRTTDTKKSRS